MLGYAVRRIQRRGENRESEKGALLTGPTGPRSALHFRRSGTGRPPKREGREEKMRDEVVPPNRTRRQTTWERVRSVVKPRERRGEKVENSVRSARWRPLTIQREFLEKKVRSARDPSERKAMIEPGHEELEFTPAGDAVGHQPQTVGPASTPGAGHVGGGPEGPTGVGPVAQGDRFRVSSATCFIQGGKGSVFSRVVDLDPIILFRPGRFGINDFTFVAEIA